VAVHSINIGSPKPAWGKEYTYSQTYGRGLRSAKDWQEIYQGLVTCEPSKKAFAEALDLRSAHVNEVTPRTSQIFRDGLAVTAGSLPNLRFPEAA